jgi:hypothetical protein
MENFAQLIQRLLELQSGGRQRSPELIAEDDRLIHGLQKRTLAGRPRQTLTLSAAPGGPRGKIRPLAEE